MLTLSLSTYQGDTYDLPTLLEWDMTLTGSVPCDCITAVCLYSPDMAKWLPHAVRFTAADDGTPLLHGVLDAYEISLSSKGLLLTLEGRGLAALLLDNEAVAVSYGYASLSDILQQHAAPYGLSCSVQKQMTGGSYSVSAGFSQWKALCGFTERFGGISPYFTPEGHLVIGSLYGSGRQLAITDDTPLLSLTKREQRYGVISQVLLIDRVSGQRQQVVNEPFASHGGCRRHVMYMPRSTGENRRYTGEEQIRLSKQEQLEVVAVLPFSFAARPGDTIALSSARLELSETYDVVACRCQLDGSGCTTTLTLQVR